ncbi:MAG: PBP1A family penicillin-binding protein [Mariprofundales bacterium]
MRVLIFMVKLGLTCSLLAVIAVTLTYFYFESQLPSVQQLADYRPALVSRVYNDKGLLLAEYADEHRILLSVKDMPQRLRNAFLAAEDEYFYQHIGINPPRIMAAALANIQAGHTVQGGSTITQQVAKNFFLTPERSYKRKIKEMWLSIKMERYFSKDDILTLYLNQIYLGRGSYGVASAAWRYFGKRVDELTLAECAVLAGLPKAPSQYAPHINPEKAKQRRNLVLVMMMTNGLEKPDIVRAAMREPIVIQPLAYTDFDNTYANRIYKSLSKQLGEESLRRDGWNIVVPYDDYAQQAAIHAVRKGVLAVAHRQPYRIPINHDVYTWPTLLEQWQTQQQKSGRSTILTDERIIPALVTEVLANKKMRVNTGTQEYLLPRSRWHWEYPKKRLKRPRRWIVGDEIRLQGDGKGGVRLAQQPLVESALYSIDLERGTLLAEVGGTNFKFSGFDRSTQALRQPGSAFKPFVYLTALDKGYTPASIILDTPLIYENMNTGDFWRPDNYGDKFAGKVTLRNALEHSRNLATIRLLNNVGIRNLMHTLDNFAFNRTFPMQLGVALGATEATLQEITESYAVLATLGQRWQPVIVQQIQDRDGISRHRQVAGHRCQTCHSNNVIATNKSMTPAEATVDPVSVFLTQNIMRGVIQHGTGRKARALKRPAAGKTGTTNDQVDAWFVGFTPQVLTGVWVGRDIPASMGRSETGGHAALPIWLEAMQAFHTDKEVKDFSVPDGIEWLMIDAKTGKPSNGNTHKPFLEAFRIGNTPNRASQTNSMPIENDSAKNTPSSMPTTTNPIPIQRTEDNFFDLGL